MVFLRQHELKYPTFASLVHKRGRHSASGPFRFRGSLDGDHASTSFRGRPEPLRIKLPAGTAIKIDDRIQLPWVPSLYAGASRQPAAVSRP